MVTIRSATAADRTFLEHMLVAAADWRPESTPRSVAEVLADPALAHYIAGWPKPGDFGVVAEDGGEPVGAAWCRQFTPEDPGYGFVAPDVPEVSVGVVAGRRGEGIGRAVMSAVIDAARQRDLAALSLSVELDNFARHLYTDLGFEVLAEADGAATMRLDLR